MDRPKLSAEEIESLLPDSAVGSSTPSEPAHAHDSFGGGAAEELRAMVTEFAAKLTHEFEVPMRGETLCTFKTLREVTGQELLARLERPTCIFAVSVPTVAERLLIELPYNSFFPLLDRLLGGGQHPCPVMRRPLTRIERRLSRRIADYFIAALCSVLPQQLDSRGELQAVECDPRVLGLQPGTALVMAELEIKVPVQTGTCHVIFERSDVTNLERLLRLGPHADVINRAAETIPGKVESQLTAVVGNAIVDAALLQGGAMEEGQVIWLDAAPDDPVLVYEGGSLKYVADKGLHQGKKAIRVLKTIG